MRVGFTYDLRREYLQMGYSEEETGEFDSDETINIIEETLRGLDHDVIRIGNIFSLTARLAAGETWDLVFNVTEGLHGRSREAQVPALLEAYDIPYTFSDPLTLALSLDKGMSKSMIRDAGIPTPDFFTVSSLEEMQQKAAQCGMGYPLFVKPVAEGTGKGITTESIVHNVGALTAQCTRLLSHYDQPILVESYLPGREFTVGIIGTGATARAIGVLEVELLENADPLVYTFLNKEYCEERVRYTIVREPSIIQEASDIALRSYRVLGCRDAGRIDLKADAGGRLCFLEANPLAGLHPSHSDLPILCSQAGMPYEDLLKEIIQSVLERTHPLKATRKKE